ncbi:hypothetical protein [Pediococcus acidilactici]|uniref:hypothetical protein n=1 Tax=Pediococcus acidilactici TaxID=1254 RepID=UPI001BD20D84|nr:hypothetical protein [Pediococcus acidilactici]MBS9400077.1 hypothetical protein [Pediococcus acidilactici]MDO7803245.1 hypothetical protein [Pediococcus acidilactici]
MNVIWSFLTTLTVNSGISDKLLKSNQNWDQYLTTKRVVFVQIEGTLNDWITKGLYDAANSLENTFNAVLKLFGIFGELNSGDAGKLYKLVV